MTGGELVEAIAAAGGVLTLEGDSLRFRVPDHAAHLVEELREHKPEVVAMLKRLGGRVAVFPHCPKCASYYLWRNDAGLFECQTCGLTEIEESTARRLV